MLSCVEQLLQTLSEAKLLLVSNFLKGDFPFVVQFSHNSFRRFFLRTHHLSLEKDDLFLDLLLCFSKLLQEFSDICLAVLSKKILCQYHFGRLEWNTCSYLLYLYPMLMWWCVSPPKCILSGAYFLTNSLHSTIRKYTRSHMIPLKHNMAFICIWLERLACKSLNPLTCMVPITSPKTKCMLITLALYACLCIKGYNMKTKRPTENLWLYYIITVITHH